MSLVPMHSVLRLPSTFSIPVGKLKEKDLENLPDGVTAYKRTPTFATGAIPAGLLNAHRTKAGVWGRIVVLEGTLVYRILEPVMEEVHLSESVCGVVEPERLHQVVADHAVRFYVEFYR